MKTDRPTVKLQIDRTKRRKSDNCCPLFININWKGTRSKESILYVKENDFKKGIYKGNKILKKRLHEIENRIYELMSEGRRFTASDVLQRNTRKTIQQVVNELCGIKKLSDKTREGYKNAVKNLQKYFGEDVQLEDLTLPQLQGFSRSIPVQPATVWTYLKIIKSILNYAVNRGYLKENVMQGWNFKGDGFRCIDKPKSKSQEEIMHYIDVFNTTTDKHIKECIGIWLSGYFFNGVALVDLMKVDWNSVEKQPIEGDYYYTFNIHRQKTKEVATIMTPVTPLTEELLELLKTKPWTKYKIQYTYVINKHLKKIDPTLTYYQCRHSFATMLVSSNVSLNTIATLLGRSVEGLSTYINKITEQKKLADATKSLKIEKIKYDKEKELEVFDKLI